MYSAISKLFNFKLNYHFNEVTDVKFTYLRKKIFKFHNIVLASVISK